MHLQAPPLRRYVPYRFRNDPNIPKKIVMMVFMIERANRNENEGQQRHDRDKMMTITHIPKPIPQGVVLKGIAC